MLQTETCQKTGSEVRKNSPDPVVKPLKWRVTHSPLTKMYCYLTSMCPMYKQTQFDLCNWYIGWVIDENSIYSVFFLPHGVSERKNGVRFFFSADIFNFFAFSCYLGIYAPNNMCQSRIRSDELFSGPFRGPLMIKLLILVENVKSGERQFSAPQKGG